MIDLSKKTYAEKLRYWATRRRVMKTLLQNGWSLKRIGDKYGITRQAVYLIVNGRPR